MNKVEVVLVVFYRFFTLGSKKSKAEAFFASLFTRARNSSRRISIFKRQPLKHSWIFIDFPRQLLESRVISPQKRISWGPVSEVHPRSDPCCRSRREVNHRRKKSESLKNRQLISGGNKAGAIKETSETD